MKFFKLLLLIFVQNVNLVANQENVFVRELVKPVMEKTRVDTLMFEAKQTLSRLAIINQQFFNENKFKNSLAYGCLFGGLSIGLVAGCILYFILRSMERLNDVDVATGTDYVSDCFIKRKVLILSSVFLFVFGFIICAIGGIILSKHLDRDILLKSNKYKISKLEIDVDSLKKNIEQSNNDLKDESADHELALNVNRVYSRDLKLKIEELEVFVYSMKQLEKEWKSKLSK